VARVGRYQRPVASGGFVARLTHWEGEPISVWTERWRVPLFEAHDEVASTSDRLKEIAGEGAGLFSVVIAESQSAGRGRRNATWYSPADEVGLWMSVLLPAPPRSVAYLPLIVGLATARAIEHATPGIDVGIEWPNDVLIDGRKVAGVLCEAAAGNPARAVEGVVAGIGVNVRTPPGGFPHDISARASSLEAAAEARVSRATLASAILTELVRATKGEGAGGTVVGAEPYGRTLSEPLLEALNDRDVLSNRRVHSEQEGPGVARGILESGALLLERDDGSRVGVVAGSVRLE